MNKQLRQLYQNFFSNYGLPSDIAERCSAPLLLSVNEAWSDAPRRLLIVGQETREWGISERHDPQWLEAQIASLPDFLQHHKGIEALQHVYGLFDFGALFSLSNTPFWWAFQKLRKETGAELLWSNLFRCAVFPADSDEEYGSVLKHSTWEEQQKILTAQHGLLRGEIEILRPTAVLFFTGPLHDEALLSEFPDAQLVAHNNFNVRQLARVESSYLPTTSLRTYHPGYLNRSNSRWAWLDEIANQIRQSD